MFGKGIITSLLFLFIFTFSTFAQMDADTTQTTRNPEFLTNAEQLVQDLSPRLSLTDQQASEIKGILVDYQQSVSVTNAESAEISEESQNNVNGDTSYEDQSEIQSDIQNDTTTDMQSNQDQAEINSQNQDSTGFQSNQNTQLGNENGVTPDVSGDPKEVANRAIENVLNDTQKTTWAVIKDAWWKDVDSRYNFNQSGKTER